MRPIVKKIILSALLLAAVFFVLNLSYFWRQSNYYFSQPMSKPQTFPADTLMILSLGIQAPIIYIDQADEKHFQEGMSQGVAHYPGTALPGQFGNVFIFGHSSDFVWAKGEYKTIFAVLPKIKIGDEIIITDSQANEFVYIVKKSTSASADDTAFLDQNTEGRKILTLQTSYPLGTALRRWMIVAEMSGN